MGGEPQAEAFGAVEPRPGQGQELGEAAAQPRQITPAADVREDADRRFRHGQQCALGRDPVATGAGDADAAAHGDAVHESDAGLGVGIFEVVEAIFVEEEGARRFLGAVDALGDGDDVTAGAEPAAFGVIDEDDAHVRVVAPFDEGPGHVADHLAVQAVQRLGPVEAQAAGEAFLDRQHVGLRRRRHVHQGIFA